METIWRLFEEAVRRHGERPAVAGADGRLRYDELDRRVRALAARLARAAHDARDGVGGIGPGDRVALLDVNSSAFLAATFAVAGLGAVLVPLNHRLAARELDEILDDAGARALLASRRLEGLVGELSRPPRVLWTEGERSAAGGFAPREVAADDLAHLYYTSGTTGRSKGVMLTHRNVCAHARAAIDELGLSSADRWGHFAPMFHLADAWANVAITAVGGTHVVEPRFEAARALATIEAERVTLTNLIPTMLAAMVASPPEQAGRSFPGLRMILSGGAPIAPVLVRRVVEVFGCEYVQTYGMTETSPYLTLSLLDARQRELPPEERLRLSARTGRPFGDVELEVVDDGGRRAPADDRTVGEIRVRGETVSPGYWRRPEETAAAFRDGWLYTGDLAVVDEHGFVDIVDRKKDVILTGGETVYSTEVEKALLEHPAVLEAAVFGVPDPYWGEAVCAAVVLVPGRDAGADELIDFCKRRIARYKAPRVIDLRDALPRTGPGKIAKHRLRAEAARPREA